MTIRLEICCLKLLRLYFDSFEITKELQGMGGGGEAWVGDYYMDGRMTFFLYFF